MDPHDAEKREFNERNIPDARITLTEDDKKLSIKAHGRRQESSSSAFSQDEDEESQTPPPPLSSRSGSIKAVTVRRSQRRGLFGRFTVIAEVEDAKLYPRSTKWLITFIAAMAAAAAPMGSGILFPSLLRIAAQFHTSSTVTNLSVALYMLSMSIFPLWWSSFSESLGRRTIYLVSFALYLVFNVLSAIANSIAMLIVMRMLAGGASASVQAVGAGTISDMFYPEERGRAMGIFYLGPLCGPLLAPIIGGALSQKWDWRATQWFLTIYGGIVLILVLFVLPETLKSQKSLQLEVEQEMAADGTGQATLGVTISRTSSRQIIQGNTKKWIKIFRRVFVDPLRIILYIRFPAIAILVCYASITFGCLYILNISIQDTFSQAPYSFSQLIVGLLYIPNSVGYVVASIFGGKWIDYIMRREAKRAGRYDEKGKLIVRPEDRMRENAWLACIIYSGALVWYGWTAQMHAYWLVPMIANFFFGVGSMLVFAAATTMLTEYIPKKASNGIALNNFVRNIFSCVGSFITSPLISAIGDGWLFTILGILGLCSSVTVWAMRKYGPRWGAELQEALK